MPTLAERAGDFSNSVNPLGQPVQLIDPTTGRASGRQHHPGQPHQPAGRVRCSTLSAAEFQCRRAIQLPDSDRQQHPPGQPSRRVSTRRSAARTRCPARSRHSAAGATLPACSVSSTPPAPPGHRHQRQLGRTASTAPVRHRRRTSSAGSRAHNTPYLRQPRNVSGEAGITGNNQEPQNWGPPQPDFSSGIASLTDAQHSCHTQSDYGCLRRHFWSRGAHNIVRRRLPPAAVQLALAAGSARQFHLHRRRHRSDFADFLLGVPDTSSIAFGNADKYLRSSCCDGYVTDDWRISPGFTVNAGARWEYGSPITELYGRLVNLDVAPRLHGSRAGAGESARWAADRPAISRVACCGPTSRHSAAHRLRLASDPGYRR